MSRAQQPQSALAHEDRFKEDVLSKLRDLGLTGYAARAFLAIVENHPVSATNLCRVTQIPDSKIYHTLKDLEERRLVIVQRGTPSLYKPLSTTSPLSSLKEILEEEHTRRISLAREVEDVLRPIAERNRSGSLELAYVVRGRQNITEKLGEIMGESRKEVVLLISDEALLRGLAGKLREARTAAKVKFAIAKNLSKAMPQIDKDRVKEHHCDCNFLISDSNKLITASDMGSKNCYAIITQDQGMIMMHKEHYDNPSCCTSDV